MGNSSVSSKSRRILLIPAIFVPFILVAALMVSAGSGQLVAAPDEAKIQPVEVMPLQLQDAYVQQKLAYGRVEAVKEAKLGFELAGTVTEVLAFEGDRVSRGQLLAKLDTQRLLARQQELHAALARSEADARLAKLSEKRVAELVAKKLESSQRLDEVREGTAAAWALVDEIKARLKSLDVELNKSRLYAPFDAFIVRQRIDPGTVISPGQSILELHQEQDYEVRIALAADDAFELHEGESYLLLNGEEHVPARLKSIAKQRSLSTRTVEVIFSLARSQSDLLPGDLLAFSYDQNLSVNGAWVPRQALSSGVRGLWNLYTVADKSKSQLEQKSVELLYAESTRVYVRGTIQDGELLVISGVQRLVPGQVVNIVNTADNFFALESENAK